MNEDPILLLAASERGRRLTERWKGLTPLFCCVLAHTDTCLLPGLSAAGATQELRAFTPAADAEAVAYGAPRCLPGLPSHPLGPPGPAGITRAAVRLGRLPVELVAAGLRIAPDVDHHLIPCAGGKRIDHGDAVPEARELFWAGLALGREMTAGYPYVVLGESVPGGTTTALALLLALGVPASGRVSGSLPGNAHARKEQVARAALRAAGLEPGEGRADALGAASQVGDPMQPLVAGFVGGAAATGSDVLLAGGSQMLAVAALVRATLGAGALERVAVGTTRWVALDPAADIPGLAAEVDLRLPLLGVNLNFAHSRHAPLRAYEQFLVKEGVGAGGACIAALLATGAGLTELHEAIDAAYDPLLAPARVGALPHPSPLRD